MFRITVFLYFVVSIIVPAGVSAQSSDDLHVAVSVFNDAHVDRAALESGLDRAAAVFRRSGIRLIWVECSQGLGQGFSRLRSAFRRCALGMAESWLDP
jgi:hypothetical protein